MLVASRLVRSRGLTFRCYSDNVRQAQVRQGEDFRPPWVYVLSRLLSYTVIPTVVVYSVFFHDFGDRDHVFQPARDWAARRKAAFYELSVEDQRFMNMNKSSVDGSSTSANSALPQHRS